MRASRSLPGTALRHRADTPIANYLHLCREKAGLGAVVHAAQDNAAAFVSQAVAERPKCVDRAVTKALQPGEIEEKPIVPRQLRCDHGKVAPKIAGVSSRRFLWPIEADFRDAVLNLHH